VTVRQSVHLRTDTVKQYPCTWLFVVALGLLGAAYCLIGLYCLMFDNKVSFPTDLRYRWLEQYTMYQGGNPQSREYHDSIIKNFHHSDVNAISHESEYPPWSYFTGMFLIPPMRWEFSRYYFGMVNGIALAIIACWAHATGKGFGRAHATLSACAVLAMCPVALCVSYGQYTVFVMACLVGCLLLCERGRDNLAGVCLGVALIKPHVAALFVLPMLVRGKVRVIVAMTAYVTGASCVVWLVTGIDPLTMLMAGFNASRHVLSPRSHNHLILAARDVFGPKAATLLMASLGGFLCLALVFLLRKQKSLLASFSVCAIICMFWSYRKHYDCVLLGFPLICLPVMARQTRLWPVMGLFLAFGASVWYPIRYAQWKLPIVNVSQTVVWLLALVVIVVLARKGYGDMLSVSKSKVTGEPNPPSDNRVEAAID